MIKIEKGVPIPKSHRGIYPFKSMDVGDSFFVKDLKDPKRTRATILSAAWYFKKKHKKYNFYTKAYVTGVRRWRVE